jgi:protein ImuA
MPAAPAGPDLTALRRLVRALEGTHGPGEGAGGLRLGLPEVDQALPWGGLPAGLHEVLGPQDDGAPLGFVARWLAGGDPAGGGPVLWARAPAAPGRLDGHGLFRLGLDPARLLLVEAKATVDVLWALEQGLRCGALAAVVGDGVTPDAIAARRLQLAAEEGRVPALLLPPAGAGPGSAIPLTRWRVASLPAPPDGGRPRWAVALERCRGGVPRDWIVEWDDAAMPVRLVEALADRSVAAVG